MLKGFWKRSPGQPLLGAWIDLDPVARVGGWLGLGHVPSPTEGSLLLKLGRAVRGRRSNSGVVYAIKQTRQRTEAGETREGKLGPRNKASRTCRQALAPSVRLPRNRSCWFVWF